MKKIISLMVAVLVLAGAAFYTATAAQKEENLSDTFYQEILPLYYRNKNFSDMNAYSIAYYTAGQYVENETDFEYYECDDNGKFYPSGDDGTFIKVDADKFDETVKKCFAYKGDFRKDYLEILDKSEVYNGIKLDNGYYDEKDNYYIIFWSYRAGSEADFAYAGYIKSGSGYKVYVKGVNLDGSDLKENEDPFYAEFDVELVGNYLKINDFKTIYSVMPKIEGLTSFEGVSYDLPKGITVDGDDCFAPGTKVEIMKSEEGDYPFDNAKLALKDTALNGKIFVFDIYAYDRGNWSGADVQPSKPVKVTFDIPEGLSKDNLKLFYIADDGKKEEIKITVDKENNKVTAELKHFSVYAFCNVENIGSGDNATLTTADKTVKSPKTGYDNKVLFAIMGISLLSAVCFGFSLKKKV